MSLLASRSQLKFLLDENVKKSLSTFLHSKGFNTVIAPRGALNGKLARLSKLEKRVFVTNDSDFTDPMLYTKERVFSVILLRIPQDDIKALLKSFSSLLKERSKPEDFEGNIIFLKEEGFEISKIGEF